MLHRSGDWRRSFAAQSEESMKKKGVKKIRLHRETLRNLDSQGLEGVVGGVTNNALCATKNPTVCAPDSNCVSCVNCGIDTHTCPP
jgi:hypothetical protein